MIRRTLRSAVNAVVPVLSIALIFAFTAGNYSLAWACGVGIVACAEARAQTGPRVSHDAAFWIHLFTAIPFLFGLTTLAFFAHSVWLETLVALLGASALTAGSILWYRGFLAPPTPRILELPPDKTELA